MQRNTTTNSRIATKAAAVLSILALLAPVSFAAPTENEADVPAQAGLHDLARLVNSDPISTASDPPRCGTPGECNYVVCPDTNCSDDETLSCDCEANGQECGFLEKFPVYDCDCSCKAKDEDGEEQDCKYVLGVAVYCEDTVEKLTKLEGVTDVFPLATS